MSQAQMGIDQNNYGKPIHDKGADIFTSNDDMMIADLPFKQIVRIQAKKGLTAINYMNMSSKETYDASCKKMYDFMESNFSKPSYQAIHSNPAESIFVWIDLKGTTLYEFCFSESDLHTIIVTAEPKWQVINCKLENGQNELHYFYNEMSHQVREFAENYISIIFNAKVTANSIEFTTERNPLHVIINPKDKSFTAKAQDGKIEKGHCSLSK